MNERMGAGAFGPGSLASYHRLSNRRQEPF